MTARAALSLLALAWLPGCGPSSPPGETALLQIPCIGHWHMVAVPGGRAMVVADELTLEAGQPMNLMRFDAWASLKLPVTDYEVTFEAQRLEGHDFFAALTFPVRSLDTCVTLVLGGWGGAVVGISSIDDQDANENSTRSEQPFVNGQWYRVRLEVRREELKAWIDDRLVVNTSLQGRHLSLRPGEIELCAPFGFATYATKGQVRGLVVRRLD